MGVDIYDGVGLFLVFLSCSYRLGVDLDFMLARSPSEVGMVTPSEGCVIGWSGGGVGSASILPGVFALVTRWCVCGANQICVGDVGVDDVWVIFCCCWCTFVYGGTKCFR